MKVHKIINILFLVIFIICISLPLLNVNLVPGRVSSSENRKLADFPKLYSHDDKVNLNINEDFENWFNDNLGFRDEINIINTKLQYHLFGKLTKTDALLGKDGWIYYITPEIIKDYQNLNLPDEKQLNYWSTSLNNIKLFLDQRDISFLSMLVLDKKTIYPEYYPDTIYKVGNKSRTDMLVEYITSKTNIEFFTPKDALIKAKEEAILYSPRVDQGHWNEYGAFIGYQELMKKVSKYIPGVKILTFDDFAVDQYINQSSIYNAIPIEETSYKFNLKAKTANLVPDKLSGLDLKQPYNCHYYVNDIKSYPKALVFGDSYFTPIVAPWLAESFSETAFIHTSNINRLYELTETLSPDIVIFEQVERMFDTTMDNLANQNIRKVEEGIESLPIVASKKSELLWLDMINDASVENQREIKIGQGVDRVSLVGWAIDPNNDSTASAIYVKVGDQYYSGNYGIERASVAEYFNNDALRYSGFIFDLNAEELLNSGEISFLIISKDGSYRYEPVIIKVR